MILLSEVARLRDRLSDGGDDVVDYRHPITDVKTLGHHCVSRDYRESMDGAEYHRISCHRCCVVDMSEVDDAGVPLNHRVAVDLPIPPSRLRDRRLFRDHPRWRTRVLTRHR